jgi:replication-associated recombination protein RarA
MSRKVPKPQPIDEDGLFAGVQTTPGGYAVDEVSSAMQKSIRRNLEEDALYWAGEFYGARPHGLWKRLRVIASEDVGMAAVSAVMTVRALYENWKQDHDFLYIAHAVILLVRAKKSHIVVNAAVAVNEGLLPKREVPDYAIDRHTERGRIKMGRGYSHFLNEGARLGNEISEADPYGPRVRKDLLNEQVGQELVKET